MKRLKINEKVAIIGLFLMKTKSDFERSWIISAQTKYDMAWDIFKYIFTLLNRADSRTHLWGYEVECCRIESSCWILYRYDCDHCNTQVIILLYPCFSEDRNSTGQKSLFHLGNSHLIKLNENFETKKSLHWLVSKK